MAVKLELYRVFKEVAETGNISVAAKNLYISQSAVSQSVKQLENALQARLFARSPRGVTLTGEGQMLYQYVRSALGLIATGEDKLSQAQQLLLGTLVIGASDTVTSFSSPPIWTSSTASTRVSGSRSSAAAAPRCSVCSSPARWTSPLPPPRRTAPWSAGPASPPTRPLWPAAATPATSATATPARRSPPSR